MWNGIVQWYGISEEDELNYVLPNRDNFGCRLFADSDLYNNGVHNVTACGGVTMDFVQQLILNEARYLTPDEQRDFCRVLMESIFVQFSPTILCVITKQVISELKVDEVVHRSLNEGKRYLVNITAELSNDEEDFGFVATHSLNVNRSIIENQTKVYVANMSDVVMVNDPNFTYSPTSGPSSQPSISFRPSISSQPSVYVSLRPSKACVLGNYAFDDGNFKQAVFNWMLDKATAEANYGPIQLWNTEKVTDMSNLFYGSTAFDEDIGCWDTSSVTTMEVSSILFLPNHILNSF